MNYREKRSKSAQPSDNYLFLVMSKTLRNICFYPAMTAFTDQYFFDIGQL
jgi:hypothetical protein